MIERTQDVIFLGAAKPEEGGGGGGTTDYDVLENKPQINGNELSGNKTASELGLQTPTSVINWISSSLQLANNTIYNGSTKTSVTLTLPASVPASFVSQINFTSGDTPTTISASGIYFNGDACDSGVFTPTANHRYSCLFCSDGVNVLGFVYEK